MSQVPGHEADSYVPEAGSDAVCIPSATSGRMQAPVECQRSDQADGATDENGPWCSDPFCHPARQEASERNCSHKGHCIEAHHPSALVLVSDCLQYGVAGGGMVKVTVTGEREVVEVNLDTSVVDPDDIEMLQDLIVVATNEALKKVEEKTNATMGKFTQGMNLPF